MNKLDRIVTMFLNKEKEHYNVSHDVDKIGDVVFQCVVNTYGVEPIICNAVTQVYYTEGEVVTLNKLQDLYEKFCKGEFV